MRPRARCAYCGADLSGRDAAPPVWCVVCDRPCCDAECAVRHAAGCDDGAPGDDAA